MKPSQKPPWREVRLGDILTERTETPNPGEIETGMIPIVAKISFSEGTIELRDDTRTRTKMILIRPGDLVVSGINAAKGAIAIYDESQDSPVAATIHYAAYMPNKMRVDVCYLWYLLRSEAFRTILKRNLPGGVKTELKAKRLLPIKIPLPPLDEQRRIVARIEELAALIEEAQGLRAKAREEAEALLKSALHSVFGKEFGPPDDWPLLSTIIERIENGWSPVCLPYPADGDDWGVLKVGAVSTGRFVPSENKTLPLGSDPRTDFEIRHGDFLFGRANTRELVGACAVVQNPPRRLLLCDKIFRFVFKPGAQVDKFYLNFALKSPPLREQIEAVASGTSSSMKNISKAKVMRLRLPLPQLEEQRRVVAYLDGLQAQVDELAALQESTQAELDALLPSVLDQAFRGEL